MNEGDVDAKLTKFFWKGLGLWPIPSRDAVICPRCHTKVIPPVGRPDIFILNPTGPTSVCEVKVLRAGETSFSFSELSDDQRRWLDRWETDGGQGYIGFGVIRQHGQRQHLDHLYLIDWPAWKEVEALISPIQASIPLRAGKGFRTELQDNNYDILTLFAPYEMERANKCWHLPEILEDRLNGRPDNGGGNGAHQAGQRQPGRGHRAQHEAGLREGARVSQGEAVG